MPRLTLIAARARNGVIGHDNRLPWHLPEDLRHFRQRTTGHTVLMGRKTWDSINRPLPGRRMVVISRQRLQLPEGVELAGSLSEAIARHADEEELFVIGGAQIYAEAWPMADRLVLTEIDLEPEGDTRLPAPEPERWRLLAREPAISANGTHYAIADYVRRSADDPATVPDR
ncbi:MAG: dihydrofolate reductase [Lautropia sp.]|nr:dihydrofolate reductase [Lautropia sp.]